MARPGFWDDQEGSRKLLEELKALKSVAEPLRRALAKLGDTSELIELARSERDSSLEADIASDLETLLKETSGLETATLLSGKNDALPCYLNIHAGAGGTDSSDWAEMLLRLYTRWSEKRGFKATILDVLPNEEAGIKRVMVNIRGLHAFGYLRSEIGVHRLVRISPFDFNQRRHTSFASVDVVPEFNDEVDIEILDKDLRLETYRASGAGGQHVNVTDSAVRITHVPTGLVVQCQNERSQHRNRAEAMKILRSRLYRLRELEREKELAAMYSDKGDIAWGNQIRSYVMHPYTLVKDHRTNVERGDVQAVLDGDIDRFVKAYLQWKSSGGGGAKK
jgi:peptide chain release factor 2